MARNNHCFGPSGKQNIFEPGDWTTQISLKYFSNFQRPRIRFSGSKAAWAKRCSQESSLSCLSGKSVARGANPIGLVLPVTPVIRATLTCVSLFQST
jgi:hypothetical protein